MRRDRLIALIRERSVKFGSFTLASGRQSDYLIDLKPTMLHPQGAILIADAILNEVHLYCETIDAFGGMELGAVPIVAVLASRSSTCKPTPGFIVRKQPKAHGSRASIDGCFQSGMRVVLIEDVTTTGGSLMKAVRAVREQGGTVLEAITVVDRMEGATALLAAEGITLVSLVSKSELL